MRIRCLGMALLLCGCSNGGGDNPPVDGATDDLSVTASDGANSTFVGKLEPMQWVEVEPGSFTMGSPAIEPCRDADEAEHPVTLTRGFTISATEVTQKQFASLMGYNPSFHRDCGDDCPVEWINWHEAAAFCNAVSVAKGKPTCHDCKGQGPAVTCTTSKNHDCGGYRLPTEAEWEYAARAGTTTAFHNGGISSCMTTDGNAGKISWYKVNSTGTPHAVAGRDANPWGLYDMSGNVYEWVDDWYRSNLGSTAATDPVGPAGGTDKVFRGGAWYYNAEHARAANRERFTPTKRFTFLGFRCVVTR